MLPRDAPAAAAALSHARTALIDHHQGTSCGGTAERTFSAPNSADFFNGGRVAPYLESGVFRPTGESLLQIQDRVLPIGGVVNGVKVVDDSTRVPLYLSTPGWATVSIRSGFRLGESHEIIGSVENLLDRNYRLHGSGTDSPGLGIQVVLRYSF